MSRKDFEILAEEISKLSDRAIRLITAAVVAAAATRINPRFDAQKFYKACGL